MSEKKVVKRAVALALSGICIILVAGLGGTIAYYTTTIDDYASTHSPTNSDYAELNSTYYNYRMDHLHNNSDYDSLFSQNTNLQAWLDGNITSFEAQISTMNATITQMEEWLTRGPPGDQLTVANSVQAWYNETVDNETWYIENLTKQFLFNCMDQEGPESNWVWLYVNGSIVDAAAFMSITIKPAANQTTLEFSRCDGFGGDGLCVNIDGKDHYDIFSNSNQDSGTNQYIGYWAISEPNKT